MLPIIYCKPAPFDWGLGVYEDNTKIITQIQKICNKIPACSAYFVKLGKTEPKEKYGACMYTSQKKVHKGK